MQQPNGPGTEGDSTLPSPLEAAGWRLTRQRAVVFDRLQRADHEDISTGFGPGLRPKLANLGFHVTGDRLELVGSHEVEPGPKVEGDQAP
jgi:hypothetical protein